MIQYYQDLLDALPHTDLADWAAQLPKQLAAGLSEQRYGDLPKWRQSLAQLPDLQPSVVELDGSVTVGRPDDCDDATRAALRTALEGLIPWRKGPYWLYGIHLDTEWRSDWKWDRVKPHLAPLKDRLVLDVGCGNGYHCWRTLGEGARRVIGIDPSPRFVVQFQAIKQLAGRHYPIDVLPVGIEALPADMQAFDTVFSMGVLYHRRSPMDHLRELKEALRPGGQLVLETLVIEGKLGEVLVPEGRYGKMNNVWFLPSCPSLLSWMNKLGFKNARLVDSSTTRPDEQRATDWMRFQSLSDFLDPEDSSRTVEGHPAPVRAVFVAET
ncbi:tRNA 5-methoxyuridine(34)/uridine 5-oxyacetic acid(34) synthase CmoB [Marinimicrobium sp. ABcell2]|uniref:tRNA 5-methoxyuridine(34)/uridine 5-oxyacetic acid(34) synthase CmoB n=1 Tax=Marinimicrobium sp. ABcell2 TaxID=3069751 RepID=UPI0027B30716|nr:tRNA 5-methoxyuridine(34)/uridine 5-oxyacetic acid(34) synthase CmoB [Marinimicrobium sp. ABcell2]MDQ2075565.1 tRNA 5-methoxyuridine(34)/uridine 5-oxyacetic acid(34) synthase CmoB [Marinimicrobium sp. ABcell2]